MTVAVYRVPKLDDTTGKISPAHVPDPADIGAASAAQGAKADTATQPADLAAGLAGKVNTSTYTSGLAAKQDTATLPADVASHVADGSALDTALRAAYGRVFTPQQFGAKADGTTDDTAAVNAAIQAAYDAGGGTVFFARAIYRCNGQIVLPHDAATPRAGQPPIRLVGESSDWSGYLYDPDDLYLQGSVLDLRYTTAAKIFTAGLGLLSMERLTIVDQGTSSVAFLQTVNTTLHLTGVAFIGNFAKSQATCDQDAIVLGGPNSTSGNTASDAFSGYGTVIQGCYFHRIRRGVYGRSRANSVTVRDSIWTFFCGADATAAAIEFDGTGSEAHANNLVGNTIECNGYVYGVKFKNSVRNYVENGFWDYGTSFAACYRLEGTADYNHGSWRGQALPVGKDYYTSDTGTRRMVLLADGITLGGFTAAGGPDQNYVRPLKATGAESSSLWGVYRSSAEATNPSSKIWHVRQDGLNEITSGANRAFKVPAGYFGDLNGADTSAPLQLYRYASGSIELNPLAGGRVRILNGYLELPKYTTASRPSATAFSGVAIYDTDIKLPIYSDGVSWKKYDGTAA